MKLSSSAFAEHLVAGRQEVGPTMILGGPLLAPGACTTCAASSSCSCCCGVTAVDQCPEEVAR